MWNLKTYLCQVFTINLVSKTWRPLTLDAGVKANNIVTLKVKSLSDKSILLGSSFFGNPAPTEHPRGGLRWSIIEHPSNQRTDPRVLSNRSSLHIVMQSWNCWPMSTCCPIFISWLKRNGKKVEDPVYITSNWINVFFYTPANPLIPGWWVSWESTFSYWWDNKV